MRSVRSVPTRWITPADWIAQPWKNGRGVTREIVRWPAGDGAYDVRVSVAEVTASGPFSTFPGYVRWTTLVDGGPVALGAHALGPGVPLQLDGEVALAAEVGRAATLVNVLARPGLVEVGVGATDAAVDFVLALAESTALRRWHARELAAPAVVGDADVLWLRRRR